MNYESYIALAIAFGAALLALWTRFRQVWDAGSAVRVTVPDDCEIHEADRPTDLETEGESLENYDYIESPTPDSDENGPVGDDAACAVEELSETLGVKVPKASVIVYSVTQEEQIFDYLSGIMRQDYPDYEVILVNEGSAETTSELASRLKATFPERLYVTFIPGDSRNLSRRKLAQMVGIKAASGDVVVTTASNCRVPSRCWLSDLMRPFVEDPAVDVSLGYSHMDFSCLTGAWKWYRQMDATLTDCQWIGAAREGKPYRGDRNNLAFRRSLFFDNKGYANTIHLVNGDDDLFLRDIMNSENTRTAISTDSILTAEWGESSDRVLGDMKEHYQFTARFLPRWPFLMAGFSSIMQWVVVACCALAVLAGLCTPQWWFSAAAAAVILLGLWLTQILIYRRTARRLGSVCLWWSLPLFLLWHPVANFFFKLRCRARIRKNYTFT